ncbi:hypothetical protein HNY73_015094 [Argiope bruennichi]|uniref:CRAL-TRIO domain-containing protein n=1 Tax=Argiope bruennichi TaxID=94029 RepID=A0A8T0ER18_ARGBR|nr:hypothetical protein HNY73_015094 [Argiope bruennichi]
MNKPHMNFVPNYLLKKLFKFDDDEIDDARLNRNKTHYREVPGIKTRSLNELKSMLGKNTGFRPCIDDNFLLRFLTAAKYLPDETLKRLKTYYIGRNLHPQIFRNYLPSNTLSAQALDHIKALPYRAKNLSAVVVFHSPDSDLEELHNQVSIDYLPEEYGGKLSSSSLVDLNPIINEKESYFREQLQYGISNDELELD